MSDIFRQQNLDDPAEILLAEDHPGDSRLIQEAFNATERETTLHAVSTGDDALNYLHEKAGDGSLPDLALLDLNLPGRDGCEVLETIRDDPQLQYLPVIILTRSEAEDDIARCYDARANAYLTKPASPAEFSELIERVERFWFEKVRLPPLPA